MMVNALELGGGTPSAGVTGYISAIEGDEIIMTRVKLVGGSWDQEVVEVQEWASTLDTPIKENKKRDRYLIEKEYNRGLYTGEVD